jgi:hypothetical protein
LQSTDTYGSQHLDSANREKHLTFKDDRTALGRVASLTLAASIIAFAAAACTHLQGSNTVVADWGVYGGPTGDRYSPLKQINRANVSSLREVWRVETGLGGVQTSPLMIDGMLYIVTAKQDVMALDAATGRTLWTWDAPEPGEQPVRGLTYWADGGQRLLFTTAGIGTAIISIPIPWLRLTQGAVAGCGTSRLSTTTFGIATFPRHQCSSPSLERASGSTPSCSLRSKASCSCSTA